MKFPAELSEKKKLYIKACEAYYNNAGGKTLMTDAEFDLLERAIKAEDPNWSQLKKTGVEVSKKIEVPLTHFMPSLNKKYPEAYPKWRAKQAAIVMLWMAKLDGSSVQLTYTKGKPVKLVTRGDGTNGGDISFLIPHLKLPTIKYKDTLVFRVEAVLKKRIFEKKYAKEFENARAAVNGWLNRRKPHPGLKDVDFVILGLYGYPMFAGLELAKGFKFDVVDYGRHSATDASSLLKKVRKACEYDADGLVLCDPKHVLEYNNADKPKWIIAYKENDEENATPATVKKVVWQNSRLGRWIPKIEIDPVRIGGVTVTYATVHNAKWMVDRKIGPGAVVKLVRSGDVIPKIVGVEKEGKLTYPKGEHEFKGVHLVSVGRSKESDVREIHHFFTTLGVEHIAQKTIDRLYDFGLTSVASYLSSWSRRFPEFAEAEIGVKTASKIYAEFNRALASGVLLRDLMVASNCFENLGERKLQLIEKSYVDEANVLAKLVKGELSIKLVKVKGLGGKNKKAFEDGLKLFKPWLKEVLKYIKVRKPSTVELKPKSGKLKDIKFTFTGYRDKDQEQWVTDNGGEIVSFGKQTQVLFYKAGGKKSSKIEKASDNGIQVTTFEDYRK